MNALWIISPVLMQLAIAIVLFFMWGRVNAQKWTSVVGSGLAMLLNVALFYKIWAGGTLVMHSGNWQAPFGISFVADSLALTMVTLTGFAGFAVSLYSIAGIGPSRIRFGYFPILHLLLMGLMGAFLTGDLFNLYVWFEIIIIASFVLLTIGSEKLQLKGAVNYVVINLIASVIFLTGIAVLYGLTGSLNMADLSLKVRLIENSSLIHISGLLFFVGFGIKSAIFPLYFWLPSSYHTPPASVAAIFGGLLTKVGIYALLRIFTMIFVADAFWLTLFGSVAVLTMIVGGLGAIVQKQLRHVLSFLIVCHIGFMMVGLALYSEAGFTGAVFYLIHDIIVKTNIFLVGGVIFLFTGTYELKKCGGIYFERPVFSIMAAVVIFSLVGIPPLSGFWPKLYLLQGSFAQKEYWIVGAILFASFATLYALARVWMEAFWKKAPKDMPGPLLQKLEIWNSPRGKALVAPIIFLAILSLYIGFSAEHIATLSGRISEELMQPTYYIDQVLNPKNTSYGQ